MLQESDFPAVEEIAAELAFLPEDVEPEFVESDDDTPHIDVRLQVWPDGSWAIHTGDASYDQDHRGYWGAGCVCADDDAAALLTLASDLRNEAMEQAWEEEGFEGA